MVEKGDWIGLGMALVDVATSVPDSDSGVLMVEVDGLVLVGAPIYRGGCG